MHDALQVAVKRHVDIAQDLQAADLQHIFQSEVSGDHVQGTA